MEYNGRRHSRQPLGTAHPKLRVYGVMKQLPNHEKGILVPALALLSRERGRVPVTLREGGRVSVPGFNIVTSELLVCGAEYGKGSLDDRLQSQKAKDMSLARQRQKLKSILGTK